MSVFASSLLGRLCGLALVATSLAAQATSVPLEADGQWHPFAGDDLTSTSGGVEWIDTEDGTAVGYGSPLRFDFTVAAGQIGTLTIVDGAFAGDTFQVFNHGVLLGQTSGVPVGVYGTAANVGDDFDAALADPSFSRGVFVLAAGSYSITGVLAQSLMWDGGNGVLLPLHATNGGLKLSVGTVPEPSSLLLALSALGVCGAVSRHRALASASR